MGISWLVGGLEQAVGSTPTSWCGRPCWALTVSFTLLPWSFMEPCLVESLQCLSVVAWVVVCVLARGEGDPCALPLPQVLGTAVWLQLRVFILIGVTPARHDPFIGQQLEQFVVTSGFKKEGVIQELVPDWLCECHRDWWVLSDPCLGHSGSTGWLHVREISTVRRLLPYLQASLVGCCFGALSDQWCCDNGLDSLDVACSSDSSDPFVCLQVAQLGALSAVAYMDLVLVWPCRCHSTWWVLYDLCLGHDGITVWLHERGLPMVPCLIPYIKECLVGCCPVAPSDLWCHYDGLDGPPQPVELT